MRHYYDSRIFPFLSDLLYEQLSNFNWESSRREIEEEKKLKKECGKDKNRCNYLQVLDRDWNNDIRFYSPSFELVDDQYVFKTTVPKKLNPKDIEISVADGSFYFGYRLKTETGENSSAMAETLPEDLDADTLKAVVKNGLVTVTAKKVEKKEEPKEVEDDETEYEIEIER